MNTQTGDPLQRQCVIDMQIPIYYNSNCPAVTSYYAGAHNKR